MGRRAWPALVFLFACAGARPRSVLAEEPPPPSVVLPRLTQPIRIDGDLSDPGWAEAAKIETFYETNVGDNVPPPVHTVGWVGYDSRFFYVAFRCDDPDPKKIRAPFVDRDNVFSDQDFAGIILDVKNDRRSAFELFVNPRGIQDDAIVNDATGNEDFSPDVFWQSAGRIDATGWQVEMAIPLSSLRYPNKDPQTWAIILYRNYPRDFRYQMFSARLPRGSNCLVCHFGTLEGITGLPDSSHVVAAPYAAGSNTKTYPGSDAYDGAGDNEVTKGKVGLDVKWAPDTRTILDATINPDFSQIESDVAQISANERFALFYPEKRPFFLEGVDLWQTPIQAVYTRTITSPLWGARITGKLDSGTAYTALVTEDRGGGTVILPGPIFSDTAPQDFHSLVALARVRQDLGASFAGLLGTARVISGGGYNAVVGPDFQWRLSDADLLTGQYLYTVSREPDRPDLSPQWNGERLTGAGALVNWSHSARHWDWSLEYDDLAEEFRADDGFVPQVGYRAARWNAGYTVYPTGFFSRFHPTVFGNVVTDRSEDLLSRRVAGGIGFQGRGNMRGEIDVDADVVVIDGVRLPYDHFVGTVSLSPSRILSSFEVDADYGEQADVDNVRVGHGGTLSVSGQVRPTQHLNLDLLAQRRWIDENVGARSGRALTSSVARAKATYVFTPRMLIRVIGQYVETTRDQAFSVQPVTTKEGGFAGSFLFSYKLNWQTVVFVGYGDNRTLVDDGSLVRADRQFFFKVSYAFQR
ncbi:MAG TPA: DUF5916 domain-containing protein [Thermoanaerobaculia bacterium]|jgi:hypothetical protein